MKCYLSICLNAKHSKPFWWAMKCYFNLGFNATLHTFLVGNEMLPKSIPQCYYHTPFWWAINNISYINFT